MKSKNDSPIDKNDEDFVLEYLYVEDYIYPDRKPEIKEQDSEESDRGVIVIDLF